MIFNLFQYEGEIQVLYQVNIIPTLNNKKWSGKELPVKAGEKLDVIVKAADNKLICRNEEGKCKCQLLFIKNSINKYTYLKFDSCICLSVFYSWLCFDQSHRYWVSTMNIHTHTETKKERLITTTTTTIIYCLYWSFCFCLQRWWYLWWYWRWYDNIRFHCIC